MGNALLDFVLALVRDPAVAARYAADPVGALADAHLSGVTVSDVENLIPVVADSFAAVTPMFGTAAESANVWTSGAASAAFEAFDIHLPGIGFEVVEAEHIGTDLRVSMPPVARTTAPDIDDGAAIAGNRPAGEDSPNWPEPSPEPSPELMADGGGWQRPGGDQQAGDPSADPGFDLF